MADQVQPFLVLRARAEARALLFRLGEFADLTEATEPLRHYAVTSGLVDRMGAEQAWRIIADAFGLQPDDAVGG